MTENSSLAGVMPSDKKLLKLCMQFRKGVLGRRKPNKMCFAVAAPLQAFLTFLQIKTKLIEGEVWFEYFTSNHFWIELNDGRIIDPTADQFNDHCEIEMPPVYIGKRPDNYKQVITRNKHKNVQRTREVSNNRKEL